MSKWIKHYILDEQNNVVEIDGFHRWVAWMTTVGKKRRVIGSDYIGRIQVSTVFIGQKLPSTGKKLCLFETIIFKDGEGDGRTYRYETYAEAVAGHAKAVEEVRLTPYSEN